MDRWSEGLDKFQVVNGRVCEREALAAWSLAGALETVKVVLADPSNACCDKICPRFRLVGPQLQQHSEHEDMAVPVSAFLDFESQTDGPRDLLCKVAVCVRVGWVVLRVVVVVVDRGWSG